MLYSLRPTTRSHMCLLLKDHDVGLFAQSFQLDLSENDGEEIRELGLIAISKYISAIVVKMSIAEALAFLQIVGIV